MSVAAESRPQSFASLCGAGGTQSPPATICRRAMAIMRCRCPSRRRPLPAAAGSGQAESGRDYRRFRAPSSGGPPTEAAVDLCVDIRHCGGDAGLSLNVPTARRQPLQIGALGPFSQGQCEKISVAICAVMQYRMHRAVVDLPVLPLCAEKRRPSGASP
jgi:hypothetical protein